jgi:hypothetical protein
MIPLIPLAISAASAIVPEIVSWIAGDDSGKAAGKFIDVAKSVAGINDPQQAIAAIQADPALVAKLREGAIRVRLAEIDAEKAAFSEQHQTMRAELCSKDKFAARWRPFFGYVVAVSWAFQMIGLTLAILYTTIAQPGLTAVLVGSLAELSGSLFAIWSVALAVLGVNIHKRSQDKVLASGEEPPSLARSLVGMVAGGRR